jgi:hypothetical protein
LQPKKGFVVRNSTALAIVLASLLGSSVVALADPVAPAAPMAPAPADDPNQIVCKTEAPMTGTRLGARRECHTKGQWDDMQRQAQQQLNLDQALGKTGRIPGS